MFDYKSYQVAHDFYWHCNVKPSTANYFDQEQRLQTEGFHSIVERKLSNESLFNL